MFHPHTLLTLYLTAIATVTAIDKIARSARECVIYAVTDEVLPEQDDAQMVRRRVVYDTTKNMMPYDQVLYSLGWMWSNEKSACKALAHDTAVYYHGTVIPGGAYVVDSSEKVGPEGDCAHQCLLDVFRGTLASNLGCVK